MVEDAQGYDVVLVHEASDVLAAMKGTSHPDLVLLSYRLPGLTGQQVSKPSDPAHECTGEMLAHLTNCSMLWQLVRAVRQSHADVPIFALSCPSDGITGAIKGDLYGGSLQDWLKLPVDASEAIARVEGALRHQVCCFLSRCNKDSVDRFDMVVCARAVPGSQEVAQ